MNKEAAVGEGEIEIPNKQVIIKKCSTVSVRDKLKNCYVSRDPAERGE
jgi:hypothetical protein